MHANDTYTFSRDAIQQAITLLRQSYGDRLSTTMALREQHAHRDGLAANLPPDAVVWPADKQEVGTTLAYCNRLRVPVIAFGTGTSLEGQVTAPYGGICMDLSHMDQVLAVHAEDRDCVVQPGVTREALNGYIKDTGLFFPVDPGANASIGGMVATRASGTTTLRYGSMVHNVMALEVALADGRLMRIGTRARKSSAGYDLVHLLTGSEGTLGVITEITLRLHPRPAAIAAATCAFPTLRDAIAAVNDLSMTGMPLARIEFLDELEIRACNQYSKLGLAELPTLFLEFHGSETSVREDSELAQEVVAAQHGSGFAWSARPEDRSRLWRARHTAYFATMALRPGCSNLIADVCVPVSALADCVGKARAAIDQAGLVAPIIGHVGDGNFHIMFLYMPDAPDEYAACQHVYGDVVAQAQAAGGTCTGEHGIGLGKKAKLLDEYGQDVVDLMAGIKHIWDPNGILNPGKIFG